MYKWTAIDKNGHRYSEDKVGFKDILEMDKDGFLSSFHVTNGEKNVAVDLKTGLFYIGEFPFDAGLSNKKLKYRLIYFKRKRKSIGVNSVPTHIYAHLIGWQITLKGVNYKRIMFLYPNNNKLEMRDKR